MFELRDSRGGVLELKLAADGAVNEEQSDDDEWQHTTDTSA